MKTILPFALIALTLASSLALTILPAQILGKKGNQNGETDNPNVKCYFWLQGKDDDLDEDTIEVELIIKTGFLDKKTLPNLIISDKEDEFVASVVLPLEKNKNGKSHYRLLIGSNYLVHSKIWLFTKGQTRSKPFGEHFELPLRSVHIIPPRANRFSK